MLLFFPRSRGRSLAVHPAAPARLPRGILRRFRFVHLRPRRVQRVFQPASTLDALHHGQRTGSPHVLEADHASQREHLLPLHRLPGWTVVHISGWAGHHLHDDHRGDGCRPRGAPRDHVVWGSQFRPSHGLHHPLLHGQRGCTSKMLQLFLD